MKLENEHRYLVSIGTFRGENAAIARRKAALDAGLRADIIDTQDDTQTNILAALLLIAEQLEKLTKAAPKAEEKVEPKAKPKKEEFDAEKMASSIHAARIKRALTREELALIAGVSSKTVARAEQGQTDVTSKSINMICRALKIKGVETNDDIRD